VNGKYYLDGKEKIDSRFRGNDIRSNEIAALAFSKLVMTEGWVLTNLFLGEFIDYIIANTLIKGSLTAEIYMPGYTKDSICY